ncbi:MAG: DMT family protein [Deltaproteobacteria bacterium]|nr:DMT family protein [Deltaproteobacteria bacterium]
MLLRVGPIFLLLASNVFMTFAWYAHLKHHRNSPLWLVILVSWGIAFFEYLLQVPANRLGMQAGYSLAQLKTVQEVITLTVFVGFSTWFFKQPVSWLQMVGFALMGLGALCIFKPW